MDQIQPYLDYFAAHPSWALAIIFLIAFGEALLVIGLVVPSTAVLVGAGALVGTGKLEFWPVIIATAVGCILGDQVSYWAGRIFGERLRTIWPLSAYPLLVAKGEEFIKKHGGKSIAIGRFVPGVKAVIPGIVGMFGMGQIPFLVINISSGIVWSFVHVVPGVLLGQALALAGELSGRLLVMLLLLLVVIMAVGWLLRIFAGSIAPYRKAVQGRIANWARGFGNKPMRRFAHAISPENPRSVLLVLLILLGVLAIIGFVDIASGQMLRGAAGNLDLSLNNLFSEMRSAPADELMIRITMLGDTIVPLVFTAAMVLWLIWQRAWKTALAAGLTILAAQLVVILSSTFFPNHPPLLGDVANNVLNYRFPSAHAVMAGTFLGMFATLASRGLARWSQAIVVALCGSIAVAIAFSRLYLGVSWFSDILAGLLVAFILVTIFSVVSGTLSSARFRPLTFMAAMALALFTISGIHISKSYDAAEQQYVAPNKFASYNLADWTQTGWSKVPARRIDLAGVPEEQFVVQWLGTPEQLEQTLIAMNFANQPKWTWRNSFAYMNPHGELATMMPRPALHEGLKAVVTAVQPIANTPQARIALRAYRSNAVIDRVPVYLISLSHEVQKMHLNLFAVPSDLPASHEELTAFISQISKLANVEKLGEKTGNDGVVVILKPKS
jgi:membrane protein DedA with SNARE-associated domain/membrane-associated phospholipid phosphatase